MDNRKAVVVLLILAIVFSVLTLVISFDGDSLGSVQTTTTIEQGTSGEIGVEILPNGENTGG